MGTRTAHLAPRQASYSHLDPGLAHYGVYGAKYIDLVSLAPLSGFKPGSVTFAFLNTDGNRTFAINLNGPTSTHHHTPICLHAPYWRRARTHTHTAHTHTHHTHASTREHRMRAQTHAARRHTSPTRRTVRTQVSVRPVPTLAVARIALYCAGAACLLGSLVLLTICSTPATVVHRMLHTCHRSPPYAPHLPP